MSFIPVILVPLEKTFLEHTAEANFRSLFLNFRERQKKQKVLISGDVEKTETFSRE